MNKSLLCFKVKSIKMCKYSQQKDQNGSTNITHYLRAMRIRMKMIIRVINRSTVYCCLNCLMIIG